MFKVFAFGFDTCIQTISPVATDQWLHQWRAAGFVTIFQSDAASAHYTHADYIGRRV